MKLKILEVLAPRFTQQLPYNANLLTHDKQEQHLGATDPLNHRYKSASIVGWIVRTGRRAIASAQSLKVPTLILIPGLDEVVDASQTEVFIKRAPANLITEHRYPNCLHELLNETPERRDVVIADIKKWLDQHATWIHLDWEYDQTRNIFLILALCTIVLQQGCGSGDGGDNDSQRPFDLRSAILTGIEESSPGFLNCLYTSTNNPMIPPRADTMKFRENNRGVTIAGRLYDWVLVNEDRIEATSILMTAILCSNSLFSPATTTLSVQNLSLTVMLAQRMSFQHNWNQFATECSAWRSYLIVNVNKFIRAG